MKKNKITLVAGILIVLVLTLIIVKTSDKEILFSPETKIIFNGEKVKVSTVIGSVKEEMARLEEENSEKFYPPQDYTPLYNLLEENKGDLTAILSICEEFDALFCLKKSSNLNPDLRNEICGELEKRINSEYAEILDERRLAEFAEGHNIDCTLGIPQFLF